MQPSKIKRCTQWKLLLCSCLQKNPPNASVIALKPSLLSKPMCHSVTKWATLLWNNVLLQTWLEQVSSWSMTLYPRFKGFWHLWISRLFQDVYTFTCGDCCRWSLHSGAHKLLWRVSCNSLTLCGVLLNTPCCQRQWSSLGILILRDKLDP